MTKQIAKGAYLMPNDKALGTNEIGKTPEARLAFEEWIRREHFFEPRLETLNGCHRYDYPEVQLRWLTWQASRRRTLEEVIAKLRTKINPVQLSRACYGKFPEATPDEAIVFTLLWLADELESELKKEQV